MQGLLSENTFLELHFGVKHGLLGKVIRILQDIYGGFQIVPQFSCMEGL